jgi:hypothetical protein
MLTADSLLTDLWPWSRERMWGKETSPSKSTPKPQLQSTMASGPQSRSLKPEDKPYLTEGGADVAAATERQEKKKLASLPNKLLRLRQIFCLNTNTRTECWKSNTRTTKNEIQLFLNLEFLFLCVCFVHCLFVHNLSLLICLVLFLFFLFFHSWFC